MPQLRLSTAKQVFKKILRREIEKVGVIQRRETRGKGCRNGSSTDWGWPDDMLRKGLLHSDIQGFVQDVSSQTCTLCCAPGLYIALPSTHWLRQELKNHPQAIPLHLLLPHTHVQLITEFRMAFTFIPFHFSLTYGWSHHHFYLRWHDDGLVTTFPTVISLWLLKCKLDQAILCLMHPVFVLFQREA